MLLCHRHHQFSHQPGWSITGTGTELRIHHPDRTTEISRPPGPDPPAGNPPQADTTDQEQPTNNAPAPLGPDTPLACQPEQLTLA